MYSKGVGGDEALKRSGEKQISLPAFYSFNSVAPHPPSQVSLEPAKNQRGSEYQGADVHYR